MVCSGRRCDWSMPLALLMSLAGKKSTVWFGEGNAWGNGADFLLYHLILACSKHFTGKQTKSGNNDNNNSKHWLTAPKYWVWFTGGGGGGGSISQ